MKIGRDLLIIIFLILLSAFFRFYNLEKKAVFFADEERDAYVVYKTIIKDGHLTLIGPSTSVGNLYLGPAWYYFLLPWYFIFSGDPIAAPIAISFIGVLTTVLFYLFGKEMFGKRVGFISGIIYGASHFIISVTNRAWNPSLIPITSLIFLYSLYKLKNGEKKYWWLILSCLGLGIQFHLTAFLFFPALIIFILVNKIKLPSPKYFILYTLYFILLLSPLIIFDFRHNFWNCKAVSVFLKNLITGANFGNQKLIINRYYYSIFYPALIYFFSFFLSKIFRGRLFGFILLPLLGIYIFINSLKVLKEDNKLSLFYKKQAVRYAIGKAGDERFKLEVFGPKDYEFGLRYLFYLYKIEPEISPVDFSYRHFYQTKKEKFSKVVYLFYDDIKNKSDFCSTKILQKFGGITVCLSD